MRSVLPALVAGLIFLGGISVAYGQEVRGAYVVDIPAGAYQAGSEHYIPANIAVPVGTTVAWFNDDPNQQHTVTSGMPDSEDLRTIFDSGVISEGAFFQHTFDQPGLVPYFCEIHPIMRGSVFVSDATEQGDNFSIAYGTGSTFDFTEHERSLLHIKPTSLDIPEDEPVTYEVAILKNGEEVFSDVFRTLGGHLYVELVPTDGATSVKGPDVSDPIIGAYHIEGSFLKDNAAYTIRPEITQRFSGPPEEEVSDEFGIQIVPEFPVALILPIAAGIGASIFVGRRLRK